MKRRSSPTTVWRCFVLPLLSMLGLGCDNEATPPRPPAAKSMSLGEFPEWLHAYRAELQWEPREPSRELARPVLLDSLKLGRQFMLNNQKPAGNFNYQYDFVQKWNDPDDNQVRQAGALWGFALLYQYEQDDKTRAALDKGLAFFFQHTKPGPAEGALLIAYPGEAQCDTGTVALVALSIIEYLRTAKGDGGTLADDYRRELTQKLDGYLKHLVSMRLDNGHFSRAYSFGTEYRWEQFSPYFDGEAMLCLIKAAKYVGHEELVSMIEDSALVLAKEYTADEWQHDRDSKQTKGFFQWSCMAFWEYQDAGWENSEVFGDYVVVLAHWMIHTHETLRRTRNTAYADEGIIHAYLLAKERRDEEALRELAYTIDRGLHKLTTWQVGGPLQRQNEFLSANPTDDPLAVGGVMNHRKEAPLRIDVTQHQMHAVILALRHVYTGEG